MLKQIQLSILIFIIFNACQSSTKKIIFVGDLLLDRGVRKRIEHLGMDKLFDNSIDSVFINNDIVIANLECPATKIKEPINKKFIFRAEPEWLNSLQKHGITHLNLANNHAMDQGRKGLIDTEQNILKSNIIPLGFGNNVKQACNEVLISSEPRNTYLISSSRVPSENWTYLENQPSICEESIDDITIRIKKIRIKEPKSVIIVQLHWGFEHTLIPLTSQKQEAYQLIDAGADCIIGHHTHTVQSIEIYKEKIIYYGIGNFIFDQSKKINSKGLMVQLEIDESKINFTNIPFEIKKCVPQLKK